MSRDGRSGVMRSCKVCHMAVCGLSAPRDTVLGGAGEGGKLGRERFRGERLQCWRTGRSTGQGRKASDSMYESLRLTPPCKLKCAVLQCACTDVKDCRDCSSHSIYAKNDTFLQRLTEGTFIVLISLCLTESPSKLFFLIAFIIRLWAFYVDSL